MKNQDRDSLADPLHAEFGRRLAHARSRRGFGVQVQFAQRLGVSGARLSAWEKGKAFPNNLSHLKRMCELLGVSAEYLLFGDVRSLSQESYRAIVADE